MSANKTGAWIRAEAAKAVDAVVTSGRSLDAALAAAESNTRPEDYPLLRMLCYGSLRYHFRLRDQLAQLLDRPLKKRDKVVESLIVVGLFQLSDTRVPDHAAVSMTVEAARIMRLPKFAGLVNAVLRNYGRKKIAEREPGSEAARLNHPDWLIRRLKSDWPDDWQQIIQANNDRAPMWIRVNRRHLSATEYLSGNDIPGDILPGVPDAVRLAEPVGVDRLPGFADGRVSVQDAAAQLAAPWLLRDGGRRILDACAAPGGKTGHLLEIIGSGGTVTAVDSDPDRLGRISENLDRLSLAATLIAGDASKPGEWHENPAFDRILVDAPCSATGVIRRHPDIKVLRREKDIHRLSTLQGLSLIHI